MFSTRRSARSRSVTWNAIPSRALAPPATSPVHAARSMRPFETRSSVAHWYAKTSGSRTGKEAMQPTPSRTRRVTPASAPSSAIESGRGLAPRLSPTQTESKRGSASARAASASISATVVMPKKTPRWGRVKPTPLIASVEDDPAVDVEGLAGDVAGARRGQEDGQRRDVLGVVGPPQRDGGVAPALHFLDGDALFLRPTFQIVVGQGGDRAARADGVDVDVVTGELERGDAGHADDGALAAGVDGVGRAREALAGDRGDVDDDAAAAGNHLARHALQAEEHALAVDAHDAVPVGLGEIHDVRAPGDAGIVDQHIDAAERLDHAAHHLVDARQVADVGGQRQAPPAGGGDRRGGLLGCGLVDVHGGD